MDSNVLLLLFAFLGLAGIGSGDSDSDDAEDPVPEPEAQEPEVTESEIIEMDDESMVLFGTPDPDVLEGGSNNDLILALEDDDTVTGGDGDDLINPGEGEDTVDGGDGDDVIVTALDLSDIILKGETEPLVSKDSDPEKVLDVLGIDLADPPNLTELLARTGTVAVDQEIAEEFDADIVNGGAGDDEILIGTFDTATGGAGGDDFLIASIDPALFEEEPKPTNVIVEDEMVSEANPVPLITDFNPDEDTLVMEGTLEQFDRFDMTERTVTGFVTYDSEADETTIRLITNPMVNEGEQDSGPELNAIVQEDDVSIVRLSGAFGPMDGLSVQFLDGNNADILPVNLIFPVMAA